MYYFQKKIGILFFFSLIVLNATAQKNIQLKEQNTILYFIEGYNEQNYSKMKKKWFLIAKFLPLKKGLKKELQPIYEKYGKATITKVNNLSNQQSIIELTFEKDTTEKKYLVLYFNSKAKIQGLGFKSPDFNYKKIEKINSISEREKYLRIDSLVNKKYLTDNFNGNVLVIDDGNTIYKKSFGYANIEEKKLLNDSSVFELASCSKQFTAMAIMILAEQGKIKYSDTLQKFIPELPYKNITIENLLTHTSGLPDYMELLNKYWDKKKFATNYDIVNLLNQHKPKPNFLPNEIFEYSNTGYALLSIIIERASGLMYADFLAENIFKPLGMKNSRVYNTRRSKNEKIDNYAYGYVYSDKLKKYFIPDSLSDYNYVIYLDAITGDGAVNTTVNDIAIWDKALRENKLIKSSSLEKAYTSYKLKNGKETNYGYGEFVCAGKNTERLVWHGGSWPGYYTLILRFLDTKKTIIILSNNEYQSFMQIADKIALILLD